MKVPVILRVRRLAALVVVSVAAPALAPGPPAHAGAYEVVACDATKTNRAWAPYGDTALIAANGSCLAHAEYGMQVRNSVRDPNGGATIAPHGASGGIQAVAPPGTAIVRLRATATAFDELGQAGIDGWRAGIRMNDGAHAGCALSGGCAWLTPLCVDLPMSAASVQLAAVCWRSGGCARDRVRAAATLHSVTLTVRDDWYPGLAIVSGGLWGSGRWLHGEQSLTIQGQDNSGVRSLHIRADGKDVANASQHCDAYAMAPCPQIATADGTIDTRRLPDGTNQVIAWVVDAGGNVHQESSTVMVDNTAPVVSAPIVKGGSDWRAKNEFELAIAAKDGERGSGVRSVSWEMCRAADGGGCVTRSAAGAPASVTLAVPQQGEWKVRAWANDALHQGPASAWSQPLRFDDTVPGTAGIEGGAGWARDEDGSEVAVRLPGSSARGPSGIAGYVVARAPGEPGHAITARGESAVVDLGRLPEGEHTIRARAVSGAGVASDQVGEGVVRIDRTPPSVDMSAGAVPLIAPEDQWLRDGVALSVRAAAAHAGRGAAPQSESVTSGGHVEDRIDGGQPTRVRGGEMTIALNDDGLHFVTVRAIDAAGNASDPRHASFRIDRGPPRGAFERRDPSYPRRLRATVSEDCIKHVRLELQESGHEDWSAHPARTERHEVLAELPDHRIRAGRYSARFRVEDCAGNIGFVYYGSEANPLDLRLPLRDVVAVAASLETGHARATSRATVRSGGSVLVRGRVTTLEGRSVAGQRVLIQQRIGTRDWRVRAVRHSDLDGNVFAKLAVGTSRTIRLVAEESESTIEARSRSLTISVPAGVTLRASRRSLRNGQSVTFTGRLKGALVPRKGRELELQGYNPLRGRWQPVRTQGLRTNAGGRFSTTYRFTATVGATVTYRFRIRVAPRPDHPFAQGFSRTVDVTVRG